MPHIFLIEENLRKWEGTNIILMEFIKNTYVTVGVVFYNIQNEELY